MKLLVNSKIISVAVALLTLTGIALHETKIDTVTSLSLVLPAMMASYGTANAAMHLSGEEHMHVESISLENVMGRFTSTNPFTPTRHGESKKYRMQKNAPKGYHAFDNYSLPII